MSNLKEVVIAQALTNALLAKAIGDRIGISGDEMAGILNESLDKLIEQFDGRQNSDNNEYDIAKLKELMDLHIGLIRLVGKGGSDGVSG